VAAKGAAPARLLAIDVTDQAVDLAWTPVEGVDLYRVFRAGADGSFAAVATVSGASFADWGLPPSSAWRWRVSAVIGGVEGPPSIEAAAETLPRPTACGSPGHCPVGNP
jgi:poly(3-hydroxybutyrate) depolymerase